MAGNIREMSFDSILCDFGAYTSFYAYIRIQSEKVEIAVIIAHLT